MGLAKILRRISKKEWAEDPEGVYLEIRRKRVQQKQICEGTGLWPADVSRALSGRKEHRKYVKMYLSRIVAYLEKEGVLNG